MTLTATVATTAPALKESLREASAKTFKASPRGLMAAVKWLREEQRNLIAAQGNLSGPGAALSLNGVTLRGEDLRFLMMDLDDPFNASRTKAAESALKAYFHA